MSKTTRKISSILTEKKEEGTKPFDSTAEVVRVEGETVWVHMPGGVDETPAKKTINAKEGDIVQVRVANGSAWLVGNASAPPTDDVTALRALKAANIAEMASTEALRSSESARESAEQAQATANEVRSIAEQAQADAEAASTAAAEADSKATAAGTAAAAAQSSADSAAAAASAADSKAEAASTAAQAAQSSATAAGTAAANAQSSATNALNQLSYVEDVVGVLNWIAEHGSYQVTTDSEVVQGKLYFTRTGAGTEADPYVYSVVTNPTGSPSAQGWYELDSVDEAISNFITTHVVLLDDGLYITSDSSGYKVRIDNDSVDIINPSGEVVSTFSTSIKIGQGSAAFVLVSYNGISINGGQSEAIGFKIKTNGTISYASNQTIIYPVVATTEIISGEDALVVSTDNPFKLIYNGTTYTFTALGTHDVGGFAEIILTAKSYDVHYYEPSRNRRTVKVEYTRKKFRGYFRLGPIADTEDQEGMNSASIGVNPTVKGNNSLSVGSGADAQSDNSGAFGYATQTLHENQFAVGQGNDASNPNVLFMVGNSRGPYSRHYTEGLEEPYVFLEDELRSNAFAVDIDGNTEAAGDIIDGSGNVLSDKVNSSSLAAVATSGDYSDLIGTPNLAPVATTGDYDDLTNTPSLAAVATSGDYSDLIGTPNLAAVATSGDYSDLSGTPSLAAVATSGSYNDLTNKPSNATTSAAGFMSAADKTKLDKFNFASGMTRLNYGDAANTAQVWHWGNTTNKVGVGAYNNTDAARYNLLARESSLLLGKDNTNVWTISGIEGNIDINNNEYKAGDTIPLSKVICAGFVTNSTKSLDFQIPLPKDTTGRTATLNLNASSGLSVRTGSGGYLNGNQYINTSSGYTITAETNASGLTCRITGTSAFTNVSNNEACSLALNGSITFS